MILGEVNGKTQVMAKYLVPPLNYGMVEDDLTRSGVVHQLNFPFFQRLNVKTVLFLSPDDPSRRFLDFLEDQGITFIKRPCGVEYQSADGKTGLITEAEVVSALEVILSPEYYPLHVMCRLGRHLTGSVIGCLRKVQKWNLTSIFEEYRRYSGSKVRIVNEQFIELFDINLVRVPEKHPIWL